MPYRSQSGGFERASSLGHVPTVAHPLVQQTLGKYLMPADRTKDVNAISDSLVDPSALDQAAEMVRWTIATDSSPFEAEVDPHFPSTRVLFMQMAAVIVDLLKMRERQGPFADPVAIREAQRADVIAGVLPSSNLLRSDGTPPQRAFREEVANLFETSNVEGHTLLDVLLEVEAHREDVSTPTGTLVMHRCPNPECGAILDDADRGPFVPVGVDGALCPSCAEPLLATDALRVHEKFKEHGSNLEACGRVMSVAERLILLTLLKHLHGRRPSAVAQMAFITDGPLALFGEVAPIKRPLLRYLQTLAAFQVEHSFGLPVILGLEKSGRFAEHAEAIKRHIPHGQLMVLTDDYVTRYITFRGSSHGDDTYYGRHFFYRARNGSIFTLTVPPLGRIGATPNEAFRLEDYPTLRATCQVLDHIGTRLYENATIPVALAHKWCAYPLSAADHVLKLHAEEHLDKRVAASA
ncbi:MAG TPA: hypothetical protein VE972_00180 [Conexibacter sp.]|nr:hypothetical protein [Conexibacter sp.]